MNVTVCIGTYGSDEWAQMAREVALPSVDAPSVLVHASTLHEARNQAAALVETEWLCFLDADDELEPGYFEEMAKSSADLRAPLVRYVGPNEWYEPKIPDGTDDLRDGNRLVIGTLIRKSMFDEVGGFKDWPFYEDWDLWQRCYKLGATVEFTEAVYRAHMRRTSRNRKPSRQRKVEVHHAIRRANFPELYEAV